MSESLGEFLWSLFGYAVVLGGTYLLWKAISSETFSRLLGPTGRIPREEPDPEGSKHDVEELCDEPNRGRM